MHISPSSLPVLGLLSHGKYAESDDLVLSPNTAVHRYPPPIPFAHAAGKLCVIRPHLEHKMNGRPRACSGRMKRTIDHTMSYMTSAAFQSWMRAQCVQLVSTICLICVLCVSVLKCVFLCVSVCMYACLWEPPSICLYN